MAPLQQVVVGDLFRADPALDLHVRTDGLLTLPGYYRRTKNWDLIVTHCGLLVAAVEFKSQLGSFGNNFNNRSEEAIGNVADIWCDRRLKIGELAHQNEFRSLVRDDLNLEAGSLNDVRVNRARHARIVPHPDHRHRKAGRRA